MSDVIIKVKLSGLENIFLNGAVMGVAKTEIRSKSDQIADFAGVAKYIDTTVNRYYNKMYVRLASTAAKPCRKLKEKIEIEKITVPCLDIYRLWI